MIVFRKNRDQLNTIETQMQINIRNYPQLCIFKNISTENLNLSDICILKYFHIKTIYSRPFFSPPTTITENIITISTRKLSDKQKRSIHKTSESNKQHQNKFSDLASN